MILLTYLTALFLSGVAEYYSIIGLTAIFPGSFWPIVIMGATLGVAKLVTITWLYRNWNDSPLALKLYLTTATAILMLITSMGIFGYLSKAHLEHSADTQPIAANVQMLDDKIKVSKENIDAHRKALKQLDEAVDQVMARSTDEKGADKAVAIRRGQTKERSRLLQDIETEQKTITKLNEDRSPLSIKLAKAESDFGPIKYVAELIYGSGEKDIIDKAVRLVILLIMFVFDPLAVLLLIAANMSLTKSRLGVKSTTVYTYENNESPIEEEKLESAKEPPVIKAPKPMEQVVVPKENLITIDESTNESIPPITIHQAPGVYEEHHLPAETKYDYTDNYSFREKDKK